MERFLLTEAEKVGVIRRITLTRASNPNKWGKSLAPWFDDTCRKERQAYIKARRLHGKRAPPTQLAWAAYRKACNTSKSAFQTQLPDMLKYKPKQFWGMLKRRSPNQALDPAAFARFNQELFYDPTAKPDSYHPLSSSADQLITPEELRLTLRDHFKADKSSGASPLPLQLLKHLHPLALDPFTHFLNDSAISQLPPQSWRDTKVTPIYKGKGDLQDMNNYRSIAVTPPFTKIFMSIMNQRLTTIAKENDLHPPTQAGFRRYHTTIEQALILHTIIQLSNRSKKPLAIAYVDLQKAYDTIDRTKLWDALLHELNIPPDLVRIIINMYVDSKGSLHTTDGDSVFTFLTNMGVKQGDGASPELFLLFFDRVLPHIVKYFKDHHFTPLDHHLYTIASLQLFLLAFADDVALIAAGPARLQLLFSCFHLFCLENSLVINTSKTKVMLINCTGTIKCGDTPLEEVEEFRYLGLLLKAKCLLPSGILLDRLQQSRKVFNAVRANCRLLGLSNPRVKLQLVNALATSILTYGSVLYACLGNVEPTLQANNTAFEQAESFFRGMLRWALHQDRNLRGSFLYVAANQANI